MGDSGPAGAQILGMYILIRAPVYLGPVSTQTLALGNSGPGLGKFGARRPWPWEIRGLALGKSGPGLGKFGAWPGPDPLTNFDLIGAGPKSNDVVAAKDEDVNCNHG